jgi:hypothetical protein
MHAARPHRRNLLLRLAVRIGGVPYRRLPHGLFPCVSSVPLSKCWHTSWKPYITTWSRVADNLVVAQLLKTWDPATTFKATPWSRGLLEKLTVSQLVKKFHAFYGTRRFITAFTSARHMSLSWASSIQSMLSHTFKATRLNIRRMLDPTWGYVFQATSSYCKICY